MLICTGDRDSFQLVDELTTVIYPMRGVSEMKRMTPAAVEERYGVPPHQYPELAAIVGETSDNLPGVPGVGPGFAARWIKQYGDLDSVITNADKITGKKGESLREHLTDVLRNRRLNALVRDLDLPLKPVDLQVQPWDRTEVHKVFDSLEFRVLRDRLFETLSSEEEIEGDGFDVGVSELAAGGLGAWLADARVRRRAGRRARARRLARRHRRRAGPGPRDRRRRGVGRRLDDHARGRRGARAVAGRRRAAEGAPRRQGADAGPGRPRLVARRARRATPRCRRTSRDPTSAPTTSPT